MLEKGPPMFKLWQFKELPSLPSRVSSPMAWDRSEALKVLPPRNEARYAARAEEATKSAADVLDNLCDADLVAVAPAVDLMKAHDWHFDFTDDGAVWRRGSEERKAILAALKPLRPELAQALWTMYSPNGGLVPQ